jgi:hypothetical protein
MDLFVMSAFSITLMVMTFPIYFVTINLALEYLK